MKKNGFTLIELLVTLIIIGIVGVITTPIVINVINDSKQSTAESDMHGYIRAIDASEKNNVLKGNARLNGEYTIMNGNLYSGSELVLNIDIKGTLPDDGGIVDIENGNIAYGKFTFNGYDVEYLKTTCEEGKQVHKLTINYIDEDGNPVASSKVKRVCEGASYEVVSPNVDGYTPNPDVVSGTMSSGDKETTVTYSEA